MKHRRFLIFLLIAVCLFGSLKAKAVDSVKVTELFDDVPENAWYVGAVRYVYDHDIMKGMGDSTSFVNYGEQPVYVLHSDLK